jgi:hypothetical protein
MNADITYKPVDAMQQRLTQIFFQWGEKTLVDQTIFPIISYNDKKNPKVIATGFFISKKGFFITAKHILRNEDLENLFILYKDREHEVIQIQVANIFTKEKSDIAIGFLPSSKWAGSNEDIIFSPIKLSFESPKKGSQIISVGYTDRGSDKDNIKVKRDVYQGFLAEYFEGGTGKLDGKMWWTSLPIYGANSGGPVCAVPNIGVFAISSTSYDCMEDLSFISPVSDIFDIPIKIKNKILSIKDIASEQFI